MGLPRTKKYDGKECWELYMGWGKAASYNKLMKWHKVNKGFGSPMGGYFQMWKYAAHNPEEAYESFRKWYFENAVGEDGLDPNISFNGFLEILKERAKPRPSGQIPVLGKRAYAEFCQKYNLQP